MMKSKSEIIDALNKCRVEQCLCDKCSYDGLINCSGKLMEDVLALLNKSDFEVISEIMSRSKNTCMDNHSDIQGDLVIKAHLDLCFNFDVGGNIL